MTATTWECQSPFARKYYGEGKAEGMKVYEPGSGRCPDCTGSR